MKYITAWAGISFSFWIWQCNDSELVKINESLNVASRSGRVEKGHQVESSPEKGKGLQGW